MISFSTPRKVPFLTVINDINLKDHYTTVVGAGLPTINNPHLISQFTASTCREIQYPATSTATPAYIVLFLPTLKSLRILIRIYQRDVAYCNNCLTVKHVVILNMIKFGGFIFHYIFGHTAVLLLLQLASHFFSFSWTPPSSL